MDKKEIKGYMTLEATMVFPVVLGGIILILYLGFYLYNASMIKQIAIVSALRGSQVKDISVQETEEYVKKQVKELYERKILLKKEMNPKITVSSTKVGVEINTEMETLVAQGESVSDLFWNLKTKAELGEFKKANVEAKKVVAEIKLDDMASKEVGAEIKCDIFNEGEKVDISGTTRGRGFTGVIQRWNQARHRMTHGVSLVHRAPGSNGSISSVSRVLKGMPMPGHYGSERVTIQNLEIVKVDAERNVLLVKGSVPGPKGAILTIKSAVQA